MAVNKGANSTEKPFIEKIGPSISDTKTKNNNPPSNICTPLMPSSPSFTGRGFVVGKIFPVLIPDK
jgi:hypothetical protein